MSFTENAGRLGATLVAMLQTRAELAAVEVEEESLRFLSYMVRALLALLLVGIAVVLGVFLVILLFWDSYRIEAVVGVMALLLGASAWLGLQVRRDIRNKPRLLGATIAEINKDVAAARLAMQTDEE
jgi:uncharacterized membrane protein YqjE